MLLLVSSTGIRFYSTVKVMGDSSPSSRAFPIVSNGAYQGKPCIKFCVDGVSFDCKEVFILLLRHLGRARVGVNLKATCLRQLY